MQQFILLEASFGIFLSFKIQEGMSGTVLCSTKSFSEVGHASELSGDLSANLTAVSD